MDNVEFTFRPTWLTVADQRPTQIITMDGESVCMNNLW